MAVAPAAIKPKRQGRFHMGALERRNLKWGLVFISPWLFGFIFLGVFPDPVHVLSQPDPLLGHQGAGLHRDPELPAHGGRPALPEGGLQHPLLHAPGSPDRGRGRDGPGACDEPEGPRGVGLSRGLLPALDPAPVRHLVHLRRPAQPWVRTRQLGPVRARPSVAELAWRPGLYEARAGADRPARRRPVRARLPGRPSRRSASSCTNRRTSTAPVGGRSSATSRFR